MILKDIPDANSRILVASVDERAERRYKENLERGIQRILKSEEER